MYFDRMVFILTWLCEKESMKCMIVIFAPQCVLNVYAFLGLLL